MIIKKLHDKKNAASANLADAAAIERYFINILKRDRGDFTLCDICKHYISCEGKKCEYYCEGNEATVANTGQKVRWNWTCEDLDYGDCQAREDYCYQCIENDYDCFEWRGIESEEYK